MQEGRQYYLKQCVISCIRRLVFLCSTDPAFATHAVAFTTNVRGDLTLHRIVGRAGVDVDAEARSVPGLITSFNRIGMSFPKFCLVRSIK